MECIFCNSKEVKASFLPSTSFNNKVFDYKSCQSCGLHFIHPIPNNEDLLKMYPPSYQDGIDSTILQDPYKKLIGLRYSYGYQFDLLKKINFTGKVIDFGCGAANFLINCNHAGFECDGVEFNPKHVEVLKKLIPHRDFYTVDQFLNSESKYDLIRLSNVFEHFSSPIDMMTQIKSKLKPGGYILIEGPIEMNLNLALVYRKLFFSCRKILNKNYIASHTPTHIVFTNRKNQLAFLNQLNLESLHYNIGEAEWPFPHTFSSAKGKISKLNFVIARLSMFISSANRNLGNTFIYLGKA